MAKRLKIQLSSQNTASEVYFNDELFATYELDLDNEILTTIFQENRFFQRLDDSMNTLLQQAKRQGIAQSDINAVLLVGGSVQLSAVQTWIKGYFSPEKIHCQNPFVAIAQGALQLSQGLEVKDFLYHSYGVRYWNRRQNCHSWYPIIPAGTAYPMTQPLELMLRASLENQPSIELIIGELGGESGGVEVYFDGDRLVTKQATGGATTVKPLNDQRRCSHNCATCPTRSSGERSSQGLVTS